MSKPLSMNLLTRIYGGGNGVAIAEVQIGCTAQDYVFTRSRPDLTEETTNRACFRPAIVEGKKVLDLLVGDMWHEVEPV